MSNKHDLMRPEDDFWKNINSGMFEDDIQNPDSFISFKYSSRVIKSVGGKTYVKASEKKFQNGEFSEKEMEGVLEGDMVKNKLNRLKSFLFPF